jgi:hypothetical protein
MRATSTLLLAAQFLTLGHLLIVRHTICPEHGEAIHSNALNQAPAMRPTHEGAAANPALGGGAPPAEHAHDHCLARANTRERFALLPAPDSAPGPLLAATTLPLLAAVGAAPAVAVLRLAPKNSPPSE